MATATATPGLWSWSLDPPLALVLAAAHRVGVDPQREGRICVPELLHHVRRVLADRRQLSGIDPLCGLARYADSRRNVANGLAIGKCAGTWFAW